MTSLGNCLLKADVVPMAWSIIASIGEAVVSVLTLAWLVVLSVSTLTLVAAPRPTIYDDPICT